MPTDNIVSVPNLPCQIRNEMLPNVGDLPLVHYLSAAVAAAQNSSDKGLLHPSHVQGHSRLVSKSLRCISMALSRIDIYLYSKLKRAFS